MKSAKKTKTKKSSSDELRKPSKMVPAKEKEKNSWKSQSTDDFEEMEDPEMDDHFKDFDDFSVNGEEDDDDY